MKKILLFFVILGSSMMGQTPQYFNSNAAGSANSWPFNNNTTARRWQYFCPAGSLGSVGPGNNITTIYFHAASTSSKTFPILNVSLKTGSGTGLTGTVGGPFESGMTLVYSGTNVLLTTTTGGWFGITLQTPFLYDPSFPLIVEIEHNATSGTGPTINQPTTAGSWRRQYGNYNTNVIGSGDGAYANFGIDVIPAVPCTAVPGANSVVTPTAMTCPNASAMLGLATTYSFGGITYQWQSSTVSPVGPFTAVSGATSNIYSAPNLTVNTWFNLVATCTNVVGSVTTTAGQVTISPVVTSSVPYFEGFESIGTPNELPNCSWSSSGPNAQTYNSANTNGRIPRTGSNFASFYYNPAGTNYFYTNGIQLNAGVTYSAALWYQTEYYGYTNWSDLSIMYGTTQSPTGLVSIASTNGPALSNIYKSLSGTFMVPTSGLYYIAVRGTGNTSSSAQYLSWDDLEITVPCTPNSPNTPTVSLVSSTTTICSGETVNLNVSGADTYTWNTGSTVSGISETPNSTTTYTVVGTNTLTGCMQSVSQTILVNLAPQVYVFTNKQVVCSGSSAILQALGGTTYTWSNGGTSQVISVSPTTPTTYTVLSMGTNGCVGSSTQLIGVNTLPNVTASSDRTGDMCPTETAILTAVGSGVSYKWTSNVSPLVLIGNPVNVSPNSTTIYTVTATDVNGCENRSTLVQSVTNCTGINENSNLSNLSVYPNPTSADVSIETSNVLIKSIEVIDVTGKVVYSTTSDLEIVTLNLKNVASGVYYVKIQSNNTVDVVKVVKQ
jgi:hypothetical protein